MNEKLGDRIKALRELKGLSQEKVAEQCDTNSSVVSRWETGRNKPSDRFQQKLADVLGVNIDDFYVNQSRVVPESVLLKEILSICSRLNEKEQFFILEVVKGLERIGCSDSEDNQ